MGLIKFIFGLFLLLIAFAAWPVTLIIIISLGF